MIKGLKKWFKISFSSLFFLGFIPYMPGTIGSAVVIGLLWYSKSVVAPYFLPHNAVVFWISYLLFLVFCVFVSNEAKENFGSEDPKQIIIDECAGQLITFFLIPLSWRVLLLGFLLFRFYDIVKPFPIFKFEELDDGLGVTMDDVAAGVMANVSLFTILWLYDAIKAYL